MQVKFRLPLLPGVLLLLVACAQAQSQLPDPVAPAVIGRPLDQIRPSHVARAKPAPAKPLAHNHVAASSKPVQPRVQETVAVAPAVVALPAAPQKQPQQPATQVLGARAAAAGPGGYFSNDDLVLVRRYYDAHPSAVQPAKWKIGQPIPAEAALTGVPDDVRYALSPLRPGHQYVEVDGDVVLVAVQSRVVVDGISRAMR